MALRFSYRCRDCDFSSGMLMSAQEHSNTRQHNLDITGDMTPSEGLSVVSTDLAPALAQKVKDDIIMRLAKQRGVLKK